CARDAQFFDWLLPLYYFDYW
nr:immunoglobulin heavy chain junction region [Macaca mulatta]